MFPQLRQHRAGFLRGRHPSWLTEKRYLSHKIIEIEVRFEVEWKARTTRLPRNLHFKKGSPCRFAGSSSSESVWMDLPRLLLEGAVFNKQYLLVWKRDPSVHAAEENKENIWWKATDFFFFLNASFFLMNRTNLALFNIAVVDLITKNVMYTVYV